MRSFIRAGFCASLVVCVMGGIVNAASVGTDFSWLSVSGGGILVGDEGSEGENVPEADTLAFANEDSKIVFAEEGATIDFRGQGEIQEYENVLLGGRLVLRHDNALEFISDNSMFFSTETASIVARNFLMVAWPESNSYAGGLFVSTQESPTVDLSDDLSSVFAVAGAASIAAMRPEPNANPETVVSMRADTYAGLAGESVQRTLRLTAFSDEEPEGENGLDRLGELYLYQKVEGEYGPEDDDLDTRVIAYAGDARLQAGVYNTLENTHTLTAEVRVEADGDVAIRLGAPNY